MSDTSSLERDPGLPEISAGSADIAPVTAIQQVDNAISAPSSKGLGGPWRMIVRKILSAIPLIFGVITVNFLLVHAAPGDPISVLVGEFAPSEAQIAELKLRLGLDQPLIVQYLKYLGNVLQGDLGFSFIAQESVLDLIWSRLPATFLLMFGSLLLFSAIGVAVAVFVSRRPYSVLDNVGSFLAVIGYSMPAFWLGQLALLFFALHLRWLPASGMTNPRLSLTGWDYVWDLLSHLLLPTLVLGTRYLAINFRFARATMMEALSQDYITAARAKGLPEKRVLYHGFRNAILPIITVLGINIGDIMAGAVLTEIVFGWPGLGRLLYDGMYQRDYPLLLGCFLFISIGIVIVNLTVDIVYGLVDPRVRQR